MILTVKQLIDLLIIENHDAQVVIDECDGTIEFNTITSEIHQIYGDDVVVRLIKGDEVNVEEL